ncbi:hypothetical protein U9M48_001892 [Paspalum notatum var. saurae]|uniref:Uncharacterized protein n=1 Tax=Paspalum notatum var. saurae TaxID=547442 RepID=A0AAQ3PQA5_PASNO
MPWWRELLGTRHAARAPILDQAGVSLLLTSLGLSVTLPPQLGPHHTMMFRLPSIGVAMQLMDVSGRCLKNELTADKRLGMEGVVTKMKSHSYASDEYAKRNIKDERTNAQLDIESAKAVLRDRSGLQAIGCSLWAYCDGLNRAPQ